MFDVRKERKKKLSERVIQFILPAIFSSFISLSVEAFFYFYFFPLFSSSPFNIAE